MVSNSLGAAVIAGSVILGAAAIAATVYFVNRSPQSGRYEFAVAEGTSGFLAWRLDTLSGELVACRAFGGSKEEALGGGAACWQVPTPSRLRVVPTDQ
jgi:hypothetical protein